MLSSFAINFLFATWLLPPTSSKPALMMTKLGAPSTWTRQWNQVGEKLCAYHNVSTEVGEEGGGVKHMRQLQNDMFSRNSGGR